MTNKLRSNLILTMIGFLLLAISAAPTQASLMVFNSLSNANNAATRIDWLAAVGITTPEYLVDFETGFSNGQNISGILNLFPGGLIITDTGPGTPQAIIKSGNNVINGSNPVGTFSLTHDEQEYLELNFSANPIDYLAFQDIDTSGTTIRVTFTDGTQFTPPNFDTTGSTAEFIGFFRNDMPKITKVELDANGDGLWGIDTLEYGPASTITAVPEPTTFALLSLGLAGFAARRRLKNTML